jgi:F-type H+-transporting ATPase subunit epsilon
MRLQLVTPDRQVLDTEIEEVYAPGIQGQFGVLSQHVNFLTALDTGELRYRTGGQDHWVAVSGGVAEVLTDSVTILADNAALADEIDADEARAAASNAETALKDTEPGTSEASDLETDLVWARARETVAARR